MKFTAIAAAGCAVLSISALPGSAAGAETESAPLLCGGTTYVVTGFGRGEPLHVVGSVTNFVVTYARLEPSGRVVADITGQSGRTDIVSCTSTTPNGTQFTFRGFFTPRG